MELKGGMVMLGNRINELRKSKGITLKELGEILNLGESTISMYENNKRSPDYDTLNTIANYFNVSTDYLLGRTTIENNNKEIPEEFSSPEAAMQFILKENTIMGFGGFDVNKMSDDEVVEFANELLNQLRILSYKYKK